MIFLKTFKFIEGFFAYISDITFLNEAKFFD